MATASSGTVTYPIAFTSAVYSVQITEGSDHTRAMGVYSISKTSFAYVFSASDNGYWIAIGK
ncbi:MAG: hypothetical protein IKK97_04615 [Phascolarctobacterium sp.]|nr:hypothetical protein [Phascolarctobacterium sp.]